MQRAHLLSDLRGQLMETQDVTQQLREDCDEEVAQAEADMEAERVLRAGLETEIASERHQTEEARHKIGDVEEFEQQALAQKDRRLQDRRVAAKREIAEVQ